MLPYPNEMAAMMLFFSVIGLAAYGFFKLMEKSGETDLDRARREAAWHNAEKWRLQQQIEREIKEAEMEEIRRFLAGRRG